jgi:hypothetical protein
MSATAQLLLLFVVLPLIVAPIVIAIVVRRAPTVPPGHLISELLENGEPAEAELIAWKNKGPFLLDGRPMVAFNLSVRSEDEAYQLVIVQSVPRPLIGRLVKGMTLDIRVSPDHTAGAIVLPND